MKYEYQVMESDSPGVPANILNDHGAVGWMLVSITPRIVINDAGESTQRWVFYFARLLEN
jgi:hypothetical protein